MDEVLILMPNGDKFEGKSKNNQKQGQGTYTFGTNSKWGR